MRAVREIVLPETEPATEWILDRPLRKVSPTFNHGVLQLAFAQALQAWAADRGAVVTEWRFRASPPGEDIRPLVPDVAYMSFDRLRPLTAQERQTPTVAPEIVVEILSPDDRQDDVDEKRRVYFKWGVILELIANPEARTVDAYDCNGRFERVAAVESYAPKIIPDLVLPLRTMFDKMHVPG